MEYKCSVGFKSFQLAASNHLFVLYLHLLYFVLVPSNNLIWQIGCLLYIHDI